MNKHRMIALGGVLAGVIGLAFTAGVLLAQPAPTPPAPMHGRTMTHEQMHQMMDAMHGEGTSQRMHEAMGADAERLIDQCVAMMNMMGMMGDMHGDQNRQPMQDMMDRMMGR